MPGIARFRWLAWPPSIPRLVPPSAPASKRRACQSARSSAQPAPARYRSPQAAHASWQASTPAPCSDANACWYRLRLPSKASSWHCWPSWCTRTTSKAALPGPAASVMAMLALAIPAHRWIRLMPAAPMPRVRQVGASAPTSGHYGGGRRSCLLLEPEPADDFRQPLRLAQDCRRLAALPRHVGVVTSGAVHVDDASHMADAPRLFATGKRDLPHHFSGTAHAGNYVADRLTSLADQLQPS